jgi:proteic killer suppression protein
MQVTAVENALEDLGLYRPVDQSGSIKIIAVHRPGINYFRRTRCVPVGTAHILPRCQFLRSLDSTRFLQIWGTHREMLLVACCATHYNVVVIKSFKHKGLRRYYESGSKSGIQAKHAGRLRLQLAAFDTARVVEDMDVPGYRLHPLKGRAKNRWSIGVSGNWRLTFEFKDGNVYVLDYEDYH